MRLKTYLIALAFIWAFIAFSNKSHAQTLDPLKDYRYAGQVVRATDGATARSAVFNMQWLPDAIKSAKGPFTKDHFERRVYEGHALSKGCP
jgi:hypothetical protein